MTKFQDNQSPYITLLESAAPDTPAAGLTLLYAGTDGAVKKKNSAGVISKIGLDSGTAFPGSPASGDQFYRTDRNLLYYYDGTRWLTTDLYIASPTPGDAGATPYSATGTHGYFAPDPTYGMYLVAFQGTTGVFGTNDGSNYWTLELHRRNAANTNTSITTYNTAADTASNWVSHNQAIGAVLDASAKLLLFVHTKTSGPANLYISSRLAYRLIG